MAKKPELKEHEKYVESLAERFIIKKFLESCKLAGIELANYGESGAAMTLQQVKRSDDILISEYLGIDEAKLTAEKELAVAYVKGEK